jgi:hypothetical protein
MTEKRLADNPTRGRSRWGWLALLVVPLFLWAGCQNKPGDQEQLSGNAAEKKMSALSLKQLALALAQYHDNIKTLPSAVHVDPGVRVRLGIPDIPGEDIPRLQANVFKKKPLPLLSWRVAILPFIDQADLYQQFKMDEPWDGPNNKKLLEKMPRTFAPVARTNEDPYSTYYQVFVGKDAPFDGLKRSRIPASFPDGLMMTLLIAEAGKAVPWTKPEDIPYAANKPLPKLGGLFADGFNAAMADGTIRFIPRDAPEKTLRAMITPAGGEVVELAGKVVKID